MAAAKFEHLHVQTEYSFYRSTCRIGPLMNLAAGLDIRAVAITDEHTLFGAVKFFREARDHGIQPIIGCCLNLMDDRKTSAQAEAAGKRYDGLVFLAQNAEGYRNIVRLASSSRKTAGRAFVGWSLLERHHSSLIVLSGGVGGFISRQIGRGQFKEVRSVIEDLGSLFGSARFYLEIQRQGVPREARENEFLMNTGRWLGLKIVATNSIHYLCPEHRHAWECLKKLGSPGGTASTRRLAEQQGEFHLRPSAEMRALFSDVPEALDSAAGIAAQCDFAFGFGARRPLKIEPEGPKTHRQKLERMVAKALLRRTASSGRSTGGGASFAFRMRRELRALDRAGLTEAMLVAAKLADYSFSRGASFLARKDLSGLLMSYALGLTNMDPRATGLTAEAFLAMPEGRWPAFEFELPCELLPGLISYVRDLYGKHCVARLGTFRRLSAKELIRKLAPEFKVKRTQAEKLMKRLPAEPSADAMIGAITHTERLDATLGSLLSTAALLNGLPCEHSLLAASLLISPDLATNDLPTTRSREHGVVTHYSWDDLTDLGYLRFSVLGWRVLSLMDHAVNLAEKVDGKRFDPACIAADDLTALDFLGQGDLAGFQEFEDSALSHALKIVQPGCLDELVATIALSRMRDPESLGAMRTGKRDAQFQCPFIPCYKEWYAEPAVSSCFANNW